MKDSSWDQWAHDEHEQVPLAMMRAGQRARVGAVFGCRDLVHRLHEMGLRGGVEIQMIRPGSPCIIRLDGQKLCFRADETANVLVRLGAAVPC